MTRLSFPHFLVAQIVIGTLRSIAPASAVYLAVCATKPQYCKLPLALYAISELLFYLLVYLPRRATLQAPSQYSPPPLTKEQRHRMFMKCLESVQHDAVDLQYPACWFLPKRSRLKREDVVDWILWSFYNTSREQSDVSEYEDELQEYIEIIEKSFGTKLEEGHSKDEGVRCMRVQLDRVEMLHRPLLWYLLIALVDISTSIMLLVLGFEHYTPRESQWRTTFPPRPLLRFFSQQAPDGVVFPYWHRPHKSSTKLPLLFLHGIGVGWLVYIPFLRIIINGDPDVGILLPELMSISMRMTPRPVPPLPSMLTALDLVLESLSTRQLEHDPILDLPQPGHSEQMSSSRPWNRVVMMSHSYGTFISGWIIRTMVDATADRAVTYNLASKIAHVVLVDPVPILMSNAVVAHNFLYRLPSTVCPHRLGKVEDDEDFEEDENGSTYSISKPRSTLKTAFYSSPAAWLCWYFAGRDADIARTLYRTFFWTEGAIWTEDIAAFMTGCSVRDLENLTIDPHSSSMKVRRNIAIVLQGLDQVVPAQSIRRYLTREKRPKAHWTGRVRIQQGRLEICPSSTDDGHAVDGKLELLYNPTLDHAALFDHPKWMLPLAEVVQRYIRRG